MSRRTTTRLSGLNTALRRIRALPHVMNEARTETLEQWADDVLDTAEHRVPVRTGTLKRSLDKRVHPTQGVAYVGTWSSNPLEYAKYVEKGTSSIRQQPYLEPAFEEHRADVARDYRRRVREHLDVVA